MMSSSRDPSAEPPAAASTEKHGVGSEANSPSTIHAAGKSRSDGVGSEADFSLSPDEVEIGSEEKDEDSSLVSRDSVTSKKSNVPSDEREMVLSPAMAKLGADLMRIEEELGDAGTRTSKVPTLSAKHRFALACAAHVLAASAKF